MRAASDELRIGSWQEEKPDFNALHGPLGVVYRCLLLSTSTGNRLGLETVRVLGIFLSNNDPDVSKVALLLLKSLSHPDSGHLPLPTTKMDERSRAAGRYLRVLATVLAVAVKAARAGRVSRALEVVKLLAPHVKHVSDAAGDSLHVRIVSRHLHRIATAAWARASPDFDEASKQVGTQPTR